VLAGRVHTILPEIKDGTIKLLVDLDQPHNPHLRNKMRVDVDVITGRKAGTLVIDAGPAFNGKGPQPAFAVRDGVARKTTLDLGASDGKLVEIVAGARAGDRFITSDTKAFKDLDTVRISQ
jgi:HlyD family secretion protein